MNQAYDHPTASVLPTEQSTIAKLSKMNPLHVMRMATQMLRAKYDFRTATTLGKRTTVMGRASVKNFGTLNIGRRVQFVGTIVPLSIYVEPDATLSIGDGSYFNYGTSIAAIDHVSIGQNTYMGTYVSITDNAFHELAPERRLERPESQPVVIGNNVWIATRVIILPGVTIGDGAAIGAGSIVTKDVPPRSLAIGVPAKVVRAL